MTHDKDIRHLYYCRTVFFLLKSNSKLFIILGDSILCRWLPLIIDGNFTCKKSAPFRSVSVDLRTAFSADDVILKDGDWTREARARWEYRQFYTKINGLLSVLLLLTMHKLNSVLHITECYITWREKPLNRLTPLPMNRRLWNETETNVVYHLWYSMVNSQYLVRFSLRCLSHCNSSKSENAECTTHKPRLLRPSPPLRHMHTHLSTYT